MHKFIFIVLLTIGAAYWVSLEKPGAVAAIRTVLLPSTAALTGPEKVPDTAAPEPASDPASSSDSAAIRWCDPAPDCPEWEFIHSRGLANPNGDRSGPLRAIAYHDPENRDMAY